MPIVKTVNKNFFKQWSADMAYVLGFFAADGYITCNKRGAYFWCIQITDKKLLEQIKRVIASEHKISVRLRPGNESTIYRLQIGSKEMCDDLRKLGFAERKTKSLAVPNVPNQFWKSFVRGYFDGDGNVWSGYVHKDRKVPLLVVRTVFTSCSKIFLEHFARRLESFDIRRGVVSASKGSYYRLTYSVHGSLKLYDFMYNHDIQTSPPLLLSRKKRVYEKYLKNAAVAQR